jgi:arylsulfatase
MNSKLSREGSVNRQPGSITTTMKKLFLSAIITAAFLTGQAQPADRPVDRRPNIIVILADDMGFSDLGCYGGEIHTPHLDSLAYNGIRFAKFYNSSRCCPSRAALLTGLYNHEAGIGNMTNDQHEPGYRGFLTDNTVTLAEVLRSAGYHTAMAGKWHVSNTVQQSTPELQLKWLDHQLDAPLFSPLEQYPTSRGFEKFYGTLWGVVDHFDPFSLVNGTEPVRKVPPGYYHADAISDSAASYIRQFSRDPQPFFLYLAYNTPHWPVQAPAAEIATYKDTYRVGWEAIREARYRRMSQLGIIDPATEKLSPRQPAADWDQNPDKEWDARVMAVHAAMIDRMDQGIGRVIAALRQTGRLDNTLILFLSDNGASPEISATMTPGFDRPGTTRQGEKIIYPADKKTMPGPETVYASIGPAWANVANTPFRYWKIESYEGGTHTPFIAFWPKGIALHKGSIIQQAGHLIDLMPTVVEMAGANYPSSYKGHSISPMQGMSLLPVLQGRPWKGHAILFNEHHNGRSVRMGEWKLVSSDADSTWELYDMKHDGSEIKNLAARYPRKVRQMDSLWQRWALENKVFPRPVKARPKVMAGQAPQPGPGRGLTTRWAAAVSTGNVHPEYPRPQMVRDQWKSLNGEWEYAIRSCLADMPLRWDGKILAPYPVESKLSGVEKKVGPDSTLWYHRRFMLPATWAHQRILLHFGAVDWMTRVWVNGREAGSHSGGYDAFTFDITDYLKGSGGQEIVLSVWDPGNAGYQPNGKQYNQPRSIWYTATTGIWQTVWLEPVAAVALPEFRLSPDIDKNTLQISFSPGKQYTGYSIRAAAYDEGRKVAEETGTPEAGITLKLASVKRWSPVSPFLYALRISLYKGDKKVDEVSSYFGMRSIGLGKDKEGYTRLFLNKEPVFQFGLLDQGFWPDGLYTAPTDEALRYDIEMQKKAGFNMIRKHVKVEPQRWYYWCDKLGMLVWQDMPSGDAHIGRNDTDMIRSAQSALQYKTELKQLIGQHINAPCIVAWVPFNEGWGQFRTAEIATLVKSLDPGRLVDATSGWVDRGVGDMHDTHSYPWPAMTVPEAGRAIVLGEYGGQALAVKDHLWNSDLSQAPGHIRTSRTKEDLLAVYSRLVDSLVILKGKGLSAAVYTQATDVEEEVNGLMTYDREILKIDMDQLKRINRRLTGGNQ